MRRCDDAGASPHWFRRFLIGLVASSMVINLNTISSLNSINHVAQLPFAPLSLQSDAKDDAGSASNLTTLGPVQKPVATLHVGPPKTGSTTLQCTLESLRRDMETDNIVYVGRPECQGMSIEFKYMKEFRFFEQALVTGYQCQSELNEIEERRPANMTTNETMGVLPQCWVDFVKRLEGYYQEGKHFIFSDEAMASRIARTRQYRPALPYPWKLLKTVLDGMGWDVRILLVHRPLHDFIPSVYTEQYKDGPAKVRLKRWFGSGEDDNGTELCPSDGGRSVPRPFDTETDEITMARLLEKDQKLYPTPAQVNELFKIHGFKTILVDMTDTFSSKYGHDLNFIEHIVCHKLPGTVNTCKSLLHSKDSDAGEEEKENTTTKVKQLNPSLSLNYDFIAVEACQKGLINGKIFSRDVAKRAIQQRQEQELGLSATDFPLICPDNETLQNILNASLDHEQRIRAGSWNLNEQRRHSDNFWKKAVAKKKFCTVDSKKVLEDNGWIEFVTRSLQ